MYSTQREEKQREYSHEYCLKFSQEREEKKTNAIQHVLFFLPSLFSRVNGFWIELPFFSLRYSFKIKSLFVAVKIWERRHFLIVIPRQRYFIRSTRRAFTLHGAFK